MSDRWTNFLREQGANYENGVPRHFGNPQAERRAMRAGNNLVDLSAWSLIRVSGSEALTFLNGQLTNELSLVDGTQSQLSAWCSAQGRMLALFRIFLRDGDYLLQLPASLRDDTIKRLRMFVLRAKVKVESADTDLVRFGLIGPDTPALVREAVGDAPLQDDGCVTREAFTIARVPGLQPRFEIIAPPEQAVATWEKLSNRAAPAGSDAWSWHDIMAGIPTVLPQTREEFVPQMANLELVGGVNFKKGCYPGQEIVARMQYLGRLKQRMVQAHVATDAVAAGTRIFTPDVGGQSVGTVVDARSSPEGGVDMLAVVQIAAVESGELRLNAEDGPRLSVASLPYPIDTRQPKAAS